MSPRSGVGHLMAYLHMAPRAFFDHFVHELSVVSSSVVDGLDCRRPVNLSPSLRYKADPRNGTLSVFT